MLRAQGSTHVEGLEIIAPLWPLTSFVAVNPLLGLQHLPFDDATALARRWLRARTHLTLAAFRWFAEVDSTNRVAADLVRAGAGDGLVIGADHQTAGRGRRGRTWESPAGASLLVSVVLRPVPPLVTLAAGLAASDACRASNPSAARPCCR